MLRIALVAGPGAGKTTLANALTAKLKTMGYKWYNVPEYAREFIDEWGRDAITRASTVLLIAYRQMGREHKVNPSADGFVTDSPLILPWFYGRDMKCDNEAEKYLVITRLYKMFTRAFLDYDLVVHVKREKDYVEDGCRFQTEKEARAIDIEVVNEIRAHGYGVIEVSGTTDERVNRVIDKLIVSGMLAKKLPRKASDG